MCDPIGVGGTGTVWRAYDRERRQFCAAKLLRQRDAGELLRFAREQAVRLAHPRVVSPYAWAADDGMVVIVSELIDGGSLQTLLGDYGPLAEGTIVGVLDQVLDALGAVHDAQLIHRDVKPANLLLRSGAGPLEVLLADFGLTIGVRDARLTEVGTVIGTPGYLPPEVLAGGVPPDVRHDLYAVGRLALTLHAGTEVDNASAYLPQIADPALRSAIAALLARDPAKRPPSTAAARSLLQAAARDGVPRTWDGDPIVVLDQLPPLPTDWSADAGPDQDSGREVPPGRDAARDRREALLSPRTRVDAAVTDVLTATPHVAQPISAGSTAVAGPTAAPTQTAPPTTTAPTRPPPTRRWWIVSGAAVAVGVVGMVVAALSSGSAGPDPASPPDNGTTPASTTPVTPGTVEAGDPCSWQQVSISGSPDGVALTCTVVDGSYVWTQG